MASFQEKKISGIKNNILVHRDKEKRKDVELMIFNKEPNFQFQYKEETPAPLIISNKNLESQKQENEKRLKQQKIFS